jgi:hypothetical protein
MLAEQDTCERKAQTIEKRRFPDVRKADQATGAPSHVAGASLATSMASAKPAKPLYAHQDELPSLPVPSLNDTLAKYLRSVRPHATPAVGDMAR